MAKKIEAYIKLQVAAGQANPSPPVGPALGQRGVNIMEFCKAFNAKTQGMEPGLPIPTVITVYSDRSFTFITKTPPAPVLLKKSGWHQERFRSSEHGQSGYGNPCSAGRNCQDQRAGSDCCRYGSSGSYHCRNCPQHGPERGGSVRWQS